MKGMISGTKQHGKKKDLEQNELRKDGVLFFVRKEKAIGEIRIQRSPVADPKGALIGKAEVQNQQGDPGERSDLKAAEHFAMLNIYQSI